MSRSGLPLSSVLIVAVLVPFVAAMAIISWYAISRLQEHSQARMQKDIELVARSIQLPLSHALERGQTSVLQRSLDSALNIDHVVYGVYVYDQEGERVAASGTRAATIDSERAALIAHLGRHREEFGQAGSEKIFSYHLPLIDSGGRINGLLQVTRRGSDFDNYLHDVRIHSLAVAVFTGLGLILIILLGHRWAVGRHLHAMETGLLRIRTGDLHHRVVPRGPRELRLLGANLNQMLDAILSSRNELNEQRRREQVLTRRLHQSEKLAALGQLAAGVAHELGSPLSTVDGKAQRALRHTDLPPDVQDGLRVVRQETARMERIIRQLLDFGRTNPLHCNWTPADHPLRAAVSQLEGHRHARGTELELAGPQPAPLVAVDSVRLEQALTNLLDNALQACRSKVRAVWSLTQDQLHYRIEDDGPGISPAMHEHLFEPFFTTKPTGSGTGLGLAVAHAAIRDHNGVIEVGTSELGGARFDLILPLSAARPAAVPQAAAR